LPRRLSFAEFDARLKSGTLTPAEARQYLEIDPKSEVVRVRFKSKALRSLPPPGYDVDRELYLAERARQERELAFIPPRQKRVVAEGDSWFNLPIIIRPQAIADRLKSNHVVAVKNIAMWGHTLAEILAKKEYLDEIARFKPDWFTMSAGGNDLQVALANGQLVLPYDPARPIAQCLTPYAGVLLAQIADGYRLLLNEIAIKFPALPTLCYAYDYPRPTLKNGRYIGQYLKDQKYPKTTWDAVGELIINRLTNAVQPVVKAFPNGYFLDGRGTTATDPFFDDMHPDTEGFKVLAYEFEKVFTTGSLRAVARKKLRRRPRPAGRKKRQKRKKPGRNRRARA
jgi:lysophospholipase L1-like esterase